MAESGGGEEEEEVRIVILCPSADENSDNVGDFMVGGDEMTEIIVPMSSEGAESASALTIAEDVRPQVVDLETSGDVGSSREDGFVLENEERRDVPVVVVEYPLTDDIRLDRQDTVVDEEPPMMTSPVHDYMVKKVLLPKRYNPAAAESPSTSDSRGSSTSDSSVLRTLLQASGKQLMLYQAHKHKSERIQFLGGSGSSGKNGGGGDSESLSRSSSQRRRLRPQPQRRKRPSPIATTKQVLRYSVGSQTFPAGIHTPVEKTDSSCVEVERERRPEETSPEVDTLGTSLLSRQINSQIKALLLGQDYVRDERTTTTQCRHVDQVVEEEEEEKRERSEEDEEEVEEGEDVVESRIEDSLIKRRRITEDSILPVVITEAMKIVAEFNDLSFSVQHGHRSVFLEVRRKGLYGIPFPGTVPVQVVIDDEGTCRFLSVVGTTEEVRCSKNESGETSFEELRPLLRKLSIRGGHVFCPGVEADLVDAAPNTKNIIYVGPFPQRRYQSKDCSVWYMLTPSQSWLPLNEGVHKCKTCKHLERYLRSLKKSKEKRGTENVGNADFMCVWGSTEGVEI